MSLITKKVQESGVSAYLDSSLVLWVSADDVLQLLRLPQSVLQTVPARHRKCWVDFRCPNQCRYDNTKIFVDLFGLGILCNRCSSNTADYLMTLFVAEVYSDYFNCRRRSCSPRRRSVSPRRRRSSRRSVSPRRRRSSRSPRRRRSCSPPHHHHHHDRELLERVARQNDLILSSLNTLSINSSNQHLELSNLLNAIRLQNVTIGTQVAQILAAIENLGDVTGDFDRLLAELDTRFNALTAALTAAITQLSDALRNELTNINSILNNLTSSVTNINATLNNLLQAINNLDIGELIGNLTATVNTILQLLETILGILQPNIPLGKK
ncbi:calyx [Peridroma alphabaculovirus]|uniref:Calyx n=1 Tax=Peridroma alphabaculovirus TaxID=1346829 RepID=A0A068LKD9_9ABAC|nr:calyx [Peridroma alphabaculovirus]AIE47834.1 calyx [Peridroma alphabaculovirus]